MKPLTAKKALLWAIAATLVGCVVMAVHLPLEAWTKVTIASQQELLASIAWREPAEHGWVMALAAITAIIPVLATMLLAWLIWERLPARSWWARGLLLWLLLLLLDGALLRQPIMNLAVGNPADIDGTREDAIEVAAAEGAAARSASIGQATYLGLETEAPGFL